MRSFKNIHSEGTRREITEQELQNTIKSKIGLIKIFRDFTGKGLKECKDVVDKLHYSDGGYKIHDLMELFSRYSIEFDLSKAELLQILSDAIDASDKLYFTDPLDVIDQTISNIRKLGGTKVIAEQIQTLLRDM